MAVAITSTAERIGLVADLERETARRAAMAMAMEALKTRDRNTADHSDDVLTLCDAVGRRLGFDDTQLKQLAAGAQLHDVGKVATPRAILHKPGALTEAEWTVIREHTLIGERIVRSVPALAEIAPIVRHSHEHWDGSGYPDGLMGDAIPLCSRVILCADAFHAMRCDRPYRRGRSARAALAEIQACAGMQFDPGVAEAFAAVARAARNGGAVEADRFRKKRLIVLLSALAIGTGGALAAVPELREAIKSVFASSLPTTHAAAEPLVREDFNLGPVGDMLRLPPAEQHKQQRPEAHTKASEPGTGDGVRSLSLVAGGEEPAATQTGHPGRALGRDVPVPRRPGQPPSQLGGRTDPPALGLHAGPNGVGQPLSRRARDRSATR